MWKQETILVKQNWLYIGEAFNNATDDIEEGEALWIEVTNKALRNVNERKKRNLDLSFLNDEFGDLNVEERCSDESYSFEYEDRITFKTLASVAQKDSPTKYKNWHDAWKQESMRKAHSCLDSDVAEAFHRENWLEFICCPSGRSAGTRQAVCGRRPLFRRQRSAAGERPPPVGSVWASDPASPTGSRPKARAERCCP